MKELSARELQRQLGTLTEKDFPIIITKHGKPFATIESTKVMNQLYELQDYDVRSVYEENEVFRDALKQLGKNPDYLVESAVDIADTRRKKSNASGDFMEQLKAMGVTTADNFK